MQKALTLFAFRDIVIESHWATGGGFLKENGASGASLRFVKSTNKLAKGNHLEKGVWHFLLQKAPFHTIEYFFYINEHSMHP